MRGGAGCEVTTKTKPQCPSGHVFNLNFLRVVCLILYVLFSVFSFPGECFISGKLLENPEN